MEDNMKTINGFHIMCAADSYASAKLNIEMIFKFRLTETGTGFAWYTPLATRKPRLLHVVADGGWIAVTKLDDDEQSLMQYIQE
jgi:cytochrome oxidase assembly protein ShyY1